jgi:hypothetical protein
MVSEFVLKMSSKIICTVTADFPAVRLKNFLKLTFKHSNLGAFFFSLTLASYWMAYLLVEILISMSPWRPNPFMEMSGTCTGTGDVDLF